MTDEEASELAEKIADQQGIYEFILDEDGIGVCHPEDCKCRSCFVTKKTEELLAEQGGLFDETS